jgi:hypothetical protein
MLAMTYYDVRPSVPTFTGESAGCTEMAAESGNETRKLYRAGDYHLFERVTGVYKKHCKIRWRHFCAWYYDGNVEASRRHAEKALDDIKRLMTGLVELGEGRKGRPYIEVPGLFMKKWRRGERFLAKAVERHVARGRHADRAQLESRDALIARLAAVMTHQEIADEMDLTRQRVSQILAGHENQKGLSKAERKHRKEIAGGSDRFLASDDRVYREGGLAPAEEREIEQAEGRDLALAHLMSCKERECRTCEFAGFVLAPAVAVPRGDTTLTDTPGYPAASAASQPTARRDR